MRTPSPLLTLVLMVALAGLGTVGCGDNDNSAPDVRQPSAALQCEVMGSLCHDSETDAGQACHDLGHDAVQAECAARFPGCISECLGDDEGDPFCRAIGSYCHEVDDGDGPLHACHELGHDGDPAACRAGFDDCARQCLDAREALRAR